MECADMLRAELLNNTQLKQDLFFKKIAYEIRDELSKFGRRDSEIADILVKLLYHVKPSSHKSVLWFCYGRYIVENLNKHLKMSTKLVQCIDCGKWFEMDKAERRIRCDDCFAEERRRIEREKKRKQRSK